MNDRDFRDMASNSKRETFSFDPKVKAEITRTEMDKMIREVKSHLLKRKGVTVLVVKD